MKLLREPTRSELCSLLKNILNNKLLLLQIVSIFLKAEKKLADKRAFYRIVRNWWKEFNTELAVLTHQEVNLSYNFPTEQEIEEEHEKLADSEEVVRVFGDKFRSMNDFTFSCIKKLTEKVQDADLRSLTEETTKKNRELTAELENMENDLEEKTELAEDLRLRKVLNL